MERRNLAKIDTEADIAAALDALCEADPRLGRVRREAGLVPLRRRPEGFASLAGIILAQQVSAASAAAMEARLRGLLDPLTPEAVLLAPDSLLREAGLSRPKQRTLRAVAAALDEGRLELAGLAEADAETACARLTAIVGIGPWTAQCYLLFAAGHADVFPAGDLALQHAVARGLALPQRPSIRELAEISLPWSPWRSVAARLFWSYYRGMRGRDGSPAGDPRAAGK